MNVIASARSASRRSQLFTHEALMIWQGVKFPLLLFTLCWLVLVSIMACVWLLPQELNLILTRARSGIWLMMDFDPDKIINLKLPSGRAIGTPVRSVQYNSFVVIAVSKALRLAVAASAGATLLTVPFMLWLSNVSRRRANAKLERSGCGSVSFDVTDGEL